MSIAKRLSNFTLNTPRPNAVIYVSDVALDPANSGPLSYVSDSAHVTYRVYDSFTDLASDIVARNKPSYVQPDTPVEIQTGAVDIVDSGYLDGSKNIVWNATPYSSNFTGADSSNFDDLQARAYAAMLVQGNTQSLMAGSSDAS